MMSADTKGSLERARAAFPLCEVPGVSNSLESVLKRPLAVPNASSLSTACEEEETSDSLKLLARAQDEVSSIFMKKNTFRAYILDGPTRPARESSLQNSRSPPFLQRPSNPMCKHPVFLGQGAETLSSFEEKPVPFVRGRIGTVEGCDVESSTSTTL